MNDPRMSGSNGAVHPLTSPSTGLTRLLLVIGIALVLAIKAHAVGRIEIAWPTPNRAWSEGKPARDFLQHAGSGEPESGGFGGVRSAGIQFHEGIDIRPVARDRRGEPTDEVYAAMTGVVR